MTNKENPSSNNDDLLNQALKKEGLEHNTSGEGLVKMSDGTYVTLNEYAGGLKDGWTYSGVTDTESDVDTEDNKITQSKPDSSLPDGWEYWNPVVIKEEIAADKRKEFENKRSRNSSMSKDEITKIRDALTQESSKPEKKQPEKKYSTKKTPKYQPIVQPEIVYTKKPTVVSQAKTKDKTKKVERQTISEAKINTNVSKKELSKIGSLNERILEKKGFSMTNLQEKLVKFGNNLGTFGDNKDGVDGDFGRLTFDGIIKTQKSLWLEPTGVIDEDFLNYMFPEKLAKKESNVNKNELSRVGGLNERILDDNGFNMADLQNRLSKVGNELGNSGDNEDGIDGGFGKLTFEGIKLTQTVLWLEPTGVIDEDFLRYMFPEKLAGHEGVGIFTPSYITRGVMNARLTSIIPNESQEFQYTKDIPKPIALTEPTAKEVAEARAINKKRELVYKKKVAENKKIKEHYKYSNNDGFSSMFVSEPAEKIGDMTYCSRTARKNLYNLGIPYNEVKRGPSAISSMYMHGNKTNYASDLLSLPSGSNVLDLYVDSTSKYEHRAAAYLSGGEWFVLDPYSKLNENTRQPIPLDQYASAKKIIGAFSYTI